MNEPQPSPTDAGPVVLSGLEPAPGTTMTDNGGQPPPVEDGEKQANQRRAFLLGQLLEAMPNHRLQQGEANRKIRDKVRRELGLDPVTANRIRAELATRGFIHTSGTGNRISYELTDAGREYLQTLEPYPPPEPESEPVSEVIEGYQRAHLLFQLLRAEGHTLPKGQANRSLGPKDLELRPQAANRLRSRLAQEGLIKILPGKRSETYQLTQRGREVLGTLRHYPTSKVQLTGKQLNTLLETAWASAATSGGHPSSLPSPAVPADLTQVVQDVFEELRRERYSHSNLVPIHQVRQVIAEKYGPATARHDVLDEPIRELARRGRVRLVAISDPRDVNPEQLADSIPGREQTFFYLGAAHVHPGQ